MDAVRILTEAGYVEYIDMIEPLRLKTAYPVICDGAGVLMTDGEGYWSLAVLDEREIGRFVSAVPENIEFLTSHSSVVTQALCERGHRVDIHCIGACYPFPDRLPISNAGRFRRLGPDDVPLVLENYHLTSPDYVRERIAGGFLYGMETDGCLAGFMGLHGEGAMGMLEILPRYRRRGFALELESRFCNFLLDEGKVPYCHIVDGNVASVSLHKKLGFRFSHGPVDWLL